MVNTTYTGWNTSKNGKNKPKKTRRKLASFFCIYGACCIKQVTTPALAILC